MAYMIAVKFSIKTLGCKVNQYDSLVLERELASAGFVCDNKKPDVIFVNTCAVTGKAITKSRKALNSARNNFPNAKIVLMGCWPQTYEDDIGDMKADLVWGVGHFDAFMNEIAKLCSKNSFHKRIKRLELKPPESGGRSRYFLKIQDGCEQFCTYCNIPFARGKLKSRGKEEILNEIKAVAEAGYEEIVLCGIHLGLYGKEKDSRTCDLTELLKEIIKIKKLGRVRLSSIEVNDINGKLLKLIKNSHKICSHLHVPLQSGCNKILYAMNRPYSTDLFEAIIERSRKLIPDIAITTDVIVGFPGESDANFDETYDFIRRIGFSKIHVFPFSVHERTPAATMGNQIPEKIKKIRAGSIRKLGARMRKKYIRSFNGRRLKVVVEKNDNEIATGKAQYYFDVQFAPDKIIAKKAMSKKSIGRIVSVKAAISRRLK